MTPNDEYLQALERVDQVHRWEYRQRIGADEPMWTSLVYPPLILAAYIGGLAAVGYILHFIF